MDDPEPTTSVTKHYFVDEAGDGTLFDRHGRVIVGEEGCSSHFILGVLDVSDPDGVSARLAALHEEVCADPFYEHVASMKPEKEKTARLFHAKDDIPEVRERVFKLLAKEDVRFFAEVRDKAALVADIRNRNSQSPTYHYTPNKLYDEMVKRLFMNLLHKADAYKVRFATRGSSDRTGALKQALERARENFRRKWEIVGTAPIEVSSLPSKASYLLQATDYFLWATQRAFTKGEDRYIRFLWPKVGTIHDIDDRRKSPAGAYYTHDRPLTAAAIKKSARDIGSSAEGGDHTA